MSYISTEAAELIQRLTPLYRATLHASLQSSTRDQNTVQGTVTYVDALLNSLKNDEL